MGSRKHDQRPRRAAWVGLSAGLLAGCSSLSLPGGFDLINNPPGSETTRQPTAGRPEPDARGVISYPNYQVAVAQEGDTVATVASRLGLEPAAMADTNGLPTTAELRAGELLLLPQRVAAADPESPLTPEGEVDVAGLAGAALDRADEEVTPAAQAIPEPGGPEPRRHTVQRGETAFSIARAYNVSVRSLADWNGLDGDMAVREGQVLLIPPATGPAPEEAPTSPGEGTSTPLPPSASAPQPDADLPSAAETAVAAAPATGAGLDADQTSASDTARLLQPVTGPIIRGYDPSNQVDGLTFSAPGGAAVRAADGGTVATVTEDTDGTRIVVLRHSDNLLTVYANVTDLAVESGATVARGERIGAVEDGSPSFLYFELRRGFDSLDPVPFLTE